MSSASSPSLLEPVRLSKETSTDAPLWRVICSDPSLTSSSHLSSGISLRPPIVSVIARSSSTSVASPSGERSTPIVRFRSASGVITMWVLADNSAMSPSDPSSRSKSSGIGSITSPGSE